MSWLKKRARDAAKASMERAGIADVPAHVGPPYPDDDDFKQVMRSDVVAEAIEAVAREFAVLVVHEFTNYDELDSGKARRFVDVAINEAIAEAEKDD